MTATFRAPLADFRLAAYPSAAAQATLTMTAGTDTINVPGTQVFSRVPVVMNVSATLAAGTTGQSAPIRVNLIDGTSGGTNIVRNWTMACGAGAMASIHEGNLNIPCPSGFATLEFSGTSLGTTQQTVSVSGFIKSYSDS